jgi:hypothetical protein
MELYPMKHLQPPKIDHKIVHHYLDNAPKSNPSSNSKPSQLDQDQVKNEVPNYRV